MLGVTRQRKGLLVLAVALLALGATALGLASGHYRLEWLTIVARICFPSAFLIGAFFGVSALKTRLARWLLIAGFALVSLGVAFGALAARLLGPDGTARGDERREQSRRPLRARGGVVQRADRSGLRRVATRNQRSLCPEGPRVDVARRACSQSRCFRRPVRARSRFFLHGRPPFDVRPGHAPALGVPLPRAVVRISSALRVNG